MGKCANWEAAIVSLKVSMSFRYVLLVNICGCSDNSSIEWHKGFAAD
jgi:hypothetical protein